LVRQPYGRIKAPEGGQCGANQYFCGGVGTPVNPVRFGGMYQVADCDPPHHNIGNPMRADGAISCPSGMAAVQYGRIKDPETMCGANQFACYGPAPTVAVSSSSTLTDPGTVIVDYSNMSGASDDWISIAYAGSGDTASIAYIPTGGAINGSVTFGALPAGNYVVRGYFNNNYAKQAESLVFTIN
jgi:hypothetical protein